LLLVVIIISQILGYHRLAVYLLSRLFLTFAAVFLFCLIINIMHKVERLFNNEVICDFASKFRDFFGLRSGKKFTEFVFIKIAVFLVALYLLIMALLLIWSVSLSTVHKIDQAVIDGFTFANIHIEPLRIVIALFLFGVLLACGRWLAHYISRHRKFTGEKDVQVTMDSIVNYATFALVLLISLLVAGVNFTGLAVIAGALSVGIGLGLQVIVNNFVSGIILLLDKNINPGDLILVNGVEGVIKKISLRSTLVTTLANEDVIIPNTELYTNRVTNYMLRGKYGRIATHIGVAHGCKIETVKNILIEVVQQQPDILQEEPNQPKVLFAEFAATSMNFSLFYTVKDVKKKLRVASDLSIAIEKALEQNNIEVKSIAK
jgi:small-conductance mechanosensitive channel